MTDPIFEPRPLPPDIDLSTVTDSPLLARLLASRGIRGLEEMDLSLRQLEPPTALANLDVAAERIAKAIMNDERVLLVGDFDADGATSVALAITMLTAFGASQVDFLVPNRFDFGYGLTPEIVEVAADLAPALIITVDNGVSSVTGVARARELGIDVIVTDHHLPGRDRPDALAIVNPNLPECGFASKALAGVGVIYYVLSAVRARLRAYGWFESKRIAEPKMAEWLDLVALGTVADVVPLDRNNRILVEQGLKRMRAGYARPGIQALCDVAGRGLATLTASDLGFSIGPRLNAAGRLDDMTIGIRCLMADSPDTARSSAIALNELNNSRREIESDMTAEAELLLAGLDADSRAEFGLTVYDEAFHQGVVGIVASRLRERFNRPVIAFAEAGDLAPDELKGSARSVPELHIRDVLDHINTRFPGLIRKFGGHAMAAGLSIKRVHYDRFAKAFDAAVADWLPAEALQHVVVTDGELTASELCLDNAFLIERHGPWGQHFPEPMFHGDFDVVSQRSVGAAGDHLKLVVGIGGKLIDAISFRQPPLPAGARRVRLAYRLSVNRYRDAATLQLIGEHVLALK